jgi:hypothetical protein
VSEKTSKRLRDSGLSCECLRFEVGGRELKEKIDGLKNPKPCAFLFLPQTSGL